MGVGHEEAVDRVLLAGDVADDPLAAAPLAPVGGHRLALDVAAPADRHHDVLVGDQVLVGHLAARVVDDPRPALARVLPLELRELLLDDPEDPRLVRQDVLQLGDELDHGEVLVLDLLALEGGEAGQPHVEDRLGLDLGEPEAGDEVVPGGLHVGRLADRPDHLVEMVEGDLQALEDVGSLAGLAQVVLGAPADDLAAMLDVVGDDRLEGQGLGLAVHQGQHVEVERQLHRGVLEQVVQHRVRVGVVLDLDVDPHPVAVGLVAKVGDAVDPLVLHQVGDLLQQGRLVHLVGQLGDDDRDAVAARLLEGDLGPHDHPAVAVGVHLADRVDRLRGAGDRVLLLLQAEDRAAGREVGALDERAEVVRGELRVVDEGDLRVHDLAQVVRRDVRRHPDRDARRAVDQQVGQLRREDRRLAVLAVVVVREVDRLAIDVRQHLRRDRRQAGLGVAHGRRRVAVHGAEVALAVDERVAHREVLGQAHQGVVDRGVPVRVKLAHHLADDRGALPEGAVRGQPHLPHGVEDPAVDRLEAVADVRQGAGHDHAHRVVEVGRPHLVLDADRADVAQVVGHGRVLRWQSGPGRRVTWRGPPAAGGRARRR